MSSDRFGRAVLQITTDSAAFFKDINKMISKAGGLRGAFNKVGDGLQKFGNRADRAGRTMSLRLTAPIVAGTVGIVRAFGNFDAAMTSSLAIMGDVSDQMRGEMSSAARAVGKTTSFSATQAAESYFFLASAGLSAADSIGALPRVAAFAQAGNFEMARATDLLTDAQSALGLATGTAAEKLTNLTLVSDVLVKANTVANASVEQFALALTSKAGNAMNDLNIDIESGVAVLAAWADQGVKGQVAGERFAIVTRDLMNAQRNNTEAFKRAGIVVFDANGNFRDMADIVEDLERRLGPMSAEQRNAELATLGFTAKSIAATKSLIGLSDKIRTYESDLRSAGGITDEVAQKQLKGLWKQLGLTKDRLLDVAISLGAKLAPALKDVRDWIDSMVPKLEAAVDWFGDLDASTRNWTLGLIALTVAAGPALLVIGQLALGLGAVARLTGGVVGGIGATSKVLSRSLRGVGLATRMYGLKGGLAMSLRTVVGFLTGPVGIGLALTAVAGLFVIHVVRVRAAKMALAEYRAEAEKLTGRLKPFREVIGKLHAEFGTGGVTALDAYLDRLNLTGPQILEVRLAMVEYGKTNKTAKKFLDELSMSLNIAGQRLTDGKKAAEAAAESTVELVTAFELVPVPLGAAVEKMQTWTTLMVAWARNWPGKYKKTWTEQYDEIRSVDDALRALAVTYGVTISAQGLAARNAVIWTDALDELAAAYGNTISKQNQTAQSAGFLASVWRTLTGVGKSLLGSIKDIWKGMTGGKGIAGLFENLGKGIIDGFGQILANGLAGLADKAVQMVVSWVMDIMKKANVADHVREFMSRELSQGLIDAMEAARALTGGDLSAAFRLLISDAIKEATIASLADLNSWILQVHQVLSSVDEGTLSAAQAIKSMGAAWLALIPSMKDLGGNAMDLQSQFSDLITRFGATPEVIAQITAALQAMDAAGVAGVGNLVAWLGTLGIEIEGVMTAAERVEAAFEDWQAAKQHVEDLKAKLDDLKWANIEAAKSAAAVEDAYDQLAGGAATSIKSIREKWDAMAASGAISTETAEALKRAEIAKTEAQVKDSIRQQLIAAGFHGDELDAETEAVYGAWQQHVRDTEREAKRAARAQAKEARLALQQEIKDARIAAREKKRFWRDLVKALAGPGGSFQTIGGAWKGTVDWMIAEGRRFYEAMVGNSVFPDVEIGATASFKNITAAGEDSFSTLGRLGEMTFPGPEAQITRGRASVFTDTLAGVGSIAAPSTSSRSSVSRDPAFAELAEQMRGLRSDFTRVLPQVMERAARHGAQTAGRRR